MTNKILNYTFIQTAFLTGCLLFPNCSIAKLKINEVPGVKPSCSTTGELACPNGLKPSCPKQYKPSCIFVMQKQHPACLADSGDTTFYDFRLDLISCKKDK